MGGRAPHVEFFNLFLTSVGLPPHVFLRWVFISFPLAFCVRGGLFYSLGVGRVYFSFIFTLSFPPCVLHGV